MVKLVLGLAFKIRSWAFWILPMAGIVFHLISNNRHLRQLNKVGWSIVKAIEDCSSFPSLDWRIDEAYDTKGSQQIGWWSVSQLRLESNRQIYTTRKRPKQKFQTKTPTLKSGLAGYFHRCSQHPSLLIKTEYENPNYLWPDPESSTYGGALSTSRWGRPSKPICHSLSAGHFYSVSSQPVFWANVYGFGFPI